MGTVQPSAPPTAAEGSSPRILMLTGYLWGGGAEWHLLNLVWTLRQMGVPVDVAYILPGAAHAEEPWRLRGIVPIRLRWSLLALLRRNRYDLIHAHLFKGELAGATLSRLWGIPLVISRHSLDWLNLPAWQRATLSAFVHRRTRGMIAISRAVAEVCNTALAGRPVPVQVIPYGIAPELLRDKLRGTNVREQLGLQGRKLLGTAARLSPDKGLSYLLEACSLAGPELADWEIVIAGDGPERASLTALAGKLNLSSRIHWLGWREDVLDVVTALDLFAFPSIREGFGLALLEAMIFGVPAIVSDLPSIRETADDAAFYTPPANAPALAQALRQLASDPPLRAHLSDRGRQQAQRFSAETMARQTLDFYRTTVGG